MHFVFLLVFCAAVGIVLGALLRDDAREAAVLGGWITLGMIVVGLAIAWILYFLPR